MTKPNSPSTQAALRATEQLIRDHGPLLAKNAPAQLAKLKRLAQELEKTPAGKPPSAQAEQLLKEVFVWQTDLQREVLVAQLSALKKATDAKSAPMVKAQAAVSQLIEVLDVAKRGAAAPSAKVLEQMKRASVLTAVKYTQAEEAISESNAGLQMTAIEGPVVTKSGVRLSPTVPKRAAPTRR